ncbi:MAG: gliding motility-associated C-terminal domain-containing protein [Ferruginibacter sp.]
MKKFLLVSFLLICTASLKLSAQSCFNVAAGNDTTISCLQACLDLKARIPDVRTTDDYQVISIPYQPFPFTNPGGIEFNPTYLDDEFSPVIILPFTFCFYGQNYTSCAVGTNGVVTFDISNCCGSFNDFNIPPGDLIPSATYPRATIMGPFHDIDPSTATPQQPGRKMEYIIVGSAPCRKFILNFYNIPYYHCAAALVTQQIVLYEGTGIIDIFLKDKPLCTTSSNEGRSILGIQNWDWDKATAVPGRNNSAWSASNEGWRFVPSGTGSLLDSVSVFKNGTWLGTGTTLPLGNGELEATFTNICQTEDSMSYEIRAFYRQCDNPAVQTLGSDTIIVYKTLAAVTANTTDVLCNGGSNGTITVTRPVGPTLEYSIDGGATWQTSTLFTVPAGIYTITARVIGSLCVSSTVFTVTEPPVLSAFTGTTTTNCANNTGTITITATGGTPLYEYSINNGPYQTGNVFSNLPAGNYNNIKVRDANLCITNTTAVVVLNDTMYLDLGADSTICFGSSITLLPITNALTDTFKWTPAATLNFDTAKNPIASPTDTTKYYLTAKWGVCTRKDSITVNVLHKPVANAGPDTTICYKTNAFLSGSASNLSGTVNYAWSPPDSLNTPNAANTIARMDTTRKFTLTVTDNYGCNFSVTDSMTVFMQPLLVVFAGNDTTAILGRPHQLQATGGVDYVWSPTGPLDNPFIANPLATLYNDTYFHVLVTDAIGCTDDDDVFIKVYEGPMYYLPNAFSPNGDGLNDIFFPTPVGIRSTDYFRVFDRYGALMYETRQWMQGWDGTIKGKKAAFGTYVWMIKGIDKTGTVIEMKGTVILVR